MDSQKGKFSGES